MTREQAADAIRHSNGRFVGVRFTKRTTGEAREMVCRTGVVRVRGDLGGGPAYDPAAKGLLLVWDVHKHAYRTIPVEGITAIRDGGAWVEVEGGAA